MNIITVIPVSRAKVAPTLSYFTAAEAPIGAVVAVPLRSKTIHGIVIESRPVADLKAEIKGATYEIRRLGAVKADAFFPPSFMDACRTLADYYAANIGNIVTGAVADVIVQSANKIPPPLPMQPSFLAATPSPDETYAIQGDDADRLSAWKSLIRQEFARKRSVALYAPTVEDAERLFAALEKGIEGYIYLLTSRLTDKKAVAVWKAIADMAHPVVIIATGGFSLVPRSDIETVVIERENARGWISQRAPYVDGRRALETINRRAHRTVYLADSLLRTETLHRVDEKEIAEGTPFKWRSISTAKDTLVDMKGEAGRKEKGERSMEQEKETEEKEHGAEEKEQAEEDRERVTDNDKEQGKGAAKFRVLSDELTDLIARTRDESSHLFILVSRRGTASITVCADCETIVSCRQCSAPVVLHAPAGRIAGKESASREGRNFYMCHKCGERRPADLTCATCGSWRLVPLGVGIDRVHEEIAAAFPGMSVFQIDADTTKTDIQISETIGRFRSRPGSILIGTEMALPHISEQVDHVAVASLDSLFALPDFRIEERVMYALVRLRSLAARSILVQTRRADERVFEYGLKGNLSDFHRRAIDSRKRFGYPPFMALIKITLEGQKERISAEMGELQALIAPHDIDVFPAFTATVRGASVIHGLIKLDPHQWPEPELLAKLRMLPPDVSVKVDPESLL